MVTPPAFHPPVHPQIPASDRGLLAAVSRGEARLSPEQGLDLLRSMPLWELGRWADARCRFLHGHTLRTYVIDRNINYTNVCTARCTFCAFRRDASDHDAYTLPREVIHEKIAELSAIGGTQILMQGGMNPDLPLDYYLDLLGSIKQRFPSIHVHAFSPPELVEFVNFFNPPGGDLLAKCRWVLAKLQEAGLDSLPGGGGEIFAAPVRRKIGLGKCDAESWLTVMHAAHSLGMFTSATMMFGHIEGYADRIHHMLLVRDWQDRSLEAAKRGEGAQETPPGRGPRQGFGHYKAFISWPFQRENTPLGRVPHWGEDPADNNREFPGDVVARAFDWGRGGEVDHRLLGPAAAPFGRRVRMSGSTDYLRTQAVSRLMLDNIFSIGSSWVTMGPHLGQVGLAFGANDMGSVMMEENVVSSAGTTYCLDEAVLCRLIRESGFIPAQRDNAYDLLKIHDGPDAPDRSVSDWSLHRARTLARQSVSAGTGTQAKPGAPPSRVNLTVGATRAEVDPA
ncbi:MAG: radical SAM protein [Phycisphaeraceae bacterium]|nr:radical SAM protein [Phycisphaerae bacterium]MBX3391276.1 radical SAM protein [Phycisphaeraceae bacterium]